MELWHHLNFNLQFPSTLRSAGGASMPRPPAMDCRGTRMCSCSWMPTCAQISCSMMAKRLEIC